MLKLALVFVLGVVTTVVVDNPSSSTTQEAQPKLAKPPVPQRSGQVGKFQLVVHEQWLYLLDTADGTIRTTYWDQRRGKAVEWREISGPLKPTKK